MLQVHVDLYSLIALPQISASVAFSLVMASLSNLFEQAYTQHNSQTLSLYKQCQDIARRLALFSSVNEDLDDVSTGDLRYMLLDYYIAFELDKETGNRRTTLEEARVCKVLRGSDLGSLQGIYKHL